LPLLRSCIFLDSPACFHFTRTRTAQRRLSPPIRPGVCVNASRIRKAKSKVSSHSPREDTCERRRRRYTAVATARRTHGLLEPPSRSLLILRPRPPSTALDRPRSVQSLLDATSRALTSAAILPSHKARIRGSSPLVYIRQQRRLHYLTTAHDATLKERYFFVIS
jgi:hypothetical protein